VGPRAGLDSAENLAPTGIRSLDRPARSSVAIPTELPGAQILKRPHIIKFCCHTFLGDFSSAS